jgi:hypothetical protein
MRPIINVKYALGDIAPRIRLRRLPTFRGQPRAQRAIAQHVNQCRRQRIAALRRNQQTFLAVGQNLGIALDIRRYDWAAAAHRFGQDDAKALLARRGCAQHISGSVPARQHLIRRRPNKVYIT